MYYTRVVFLLYGTDTERKAGPEMASEIYKVMYGTKAATASPESRGSSRYREFTVYLDTDPGFGSMTFTRIGRSQIDFMGAELPPEQIKLTNGAWATKQADGTWK